MEEKEVRSSVATVLSDLCGPGEWMPMRKLHTKDVSWKNTHFPYPTSMLKLNMIRWPGLRGELRVWSPVSLCSPTTTMLLHLASPTRVAPPRWIRRCHSELWRLRLHVPKSVIYLVARSIKYCKFDYYSIKDVRICKINGILDLSCSANYKIISDQERYM